MNKVYQTTRVCSTSVHTLLVLETLLVSHCMPRHLGKFVAALQERGGGCLQRALCGKMDTACRTTQFAHKLAGSMLMLQNKPQLGSCLLQYSSRFRRVSHRLTTLDPDGAHNGAHPASFGKACLYVQLYSPSLQLGSACHHRYPS